jgi:AcrR family transcriptional regulator
MISEPVATVATVTKRRLGRPPAVNNPRQRILTQAAKLFAEKGYETSSVSDLAASMSVSKAAVYHYFETKQQIYDAIILATLAGLTQAVGQEVSEETSPPARLKRFMTAHARYFQANRDGFIVMLVGFSGMDSKEFREEAMQLRAEHEQLLREIIAEGVASGAFRPTDAVMTGRAVLSLLNWMVRWFRPEGGSTAEELVIQYYNLLLGGLESHHQTESITGNCHGS